ncbi:MAG: WG repeat-containing protein [Chitinophagaceae bacterium]
MSTTTGFCITTIGGNNMKTLLFLFTFLVSTVAFGQKAGSYLVVRPDTTNTQKFGYVFVNEKGDTVTRLDTAKYYVCFSDTIHYFAIVGMVNKTGWWAIDKNETPLFQVFNTSSGEPSPDELRDGMIRIVDDSGKIGFADYKGQIVIKPQFEAASGFYKDKAIIGRQCRQVLWCCEGEHADKHYTTDCKQAGYINKKGQIQKIGARTFEEVQKEIDWKSGYD